jgi:uncharacterized protein YciI
MAGAAFMARARRRIGFAGQRVFGAGMAAARRVALTVPAAARRIAGNRFVGGECSMANASTAEYLPGDPRYGLKGEALKEYYRNKPAQWVITCWYKPGTAETRGVELPAQKRYVAGFGGRVIGYGHIVTDDGTETLATTFFMQLDDRDAAEAFVAGEPLSQAGAYRDVTIQRWSNSFQKGQADYRRKGMQTWFFTGSKIDDYPKFGPLHLTAHEQYFADHEDRFVFRGPLRSPDGADNIGTALMVELESAQAARDFWNNEPFAKNGGYKDDYRIYRWVFGD